MGRRSNGGDNKPSPNEVLRRSGLLETAVRLQPPTGVIEGEDESSVDLAEYHVHSLGVYLSAAKQGPSIHLEFELHKLLDEVVDLRKFPCDKLEGPFKAFFNSGEVDYGGDFGMRKCVDGTQKQTPPISPALYMLQRTFRQGELKSLEQMEKRLADIRKRGSSRPPCVRIALTDFMRALEGDTVQRFAQDRDDEWARWTQRSESDRGVELFLARIPTPYGQVQDGDAYIIGAKYALASGAIIRVTAPVVESVRILVGGLAEDERLKELVQDLYGV